MNITATSGIAWKPILILLIAWALHLPAAFAQFPLPGFYVHMPNDIVLNSCEYDPGTFGYPTLFSDTGQVVILPYSDVIVTPLPDACFVVQRTWRVVNANFYDGSQTLVSIPNPAPNVNPSHPQNSFGPIISAPGTAAPWFPTVVKITPSDPSATDYSTFWAVDAPGYEYVQLIKYLGEADCPNDTVVVTPDCSAIVNYPAVVVNEDQPGWTIIQTAGLPSGAVFPTGTTVNHFTVTDVDGNTSTCSFKVTVKELTPPVAICHDQLTVQLDADDPNDCYDGKVAWWQASTFDDGSYDNCGNIRLTIRRDLPYSNCISNLNAINGHPDCDDVFPDFPNEFERAVSEYDSIKFYCCESGGSQTLILRAYQLNADGSTTIGTNGIPVYNECLITVEVEVTACADTTTTLLGQIKLDADEDCQPDALQFGLPGMVVRATDSEDNTYYSAGSLNGVYSFSEPVPGLLTLEVLTPSPMWEICDNLATVTIPNIPAQVIRNFNAQPLVECPALSVNLATDLLRPCRVSNWTVSYCNRGSGPAEDAYVELVASPELSFLSASKPYAINGGTMTVQLGDVAIGQCSYFSAQVETACNASVAGEQLCMEAHIFPDSACFPTSPEWSGAQIVVSGECQGDSVHFTLRNAGNAPTTETLNYVIIDDMVIMREGQVPPNLQPDATVGETIVAQGHAMRLQAEQVTGHPSAQAPSVGVENCDGITFPSLLPEFPNEDGNPFTDFECREVVSSYDPNEKLAFPRGFSDAHYLEPNVPLSYQLNFQNTGNDTAFLVVLRDTLSSLLDPATLRPGPGSHPYTWTLEGAGILTVIFDNILLPDSTTNEPASHGFVQFDIAQKPDNPIGSLIENRAGIYFDINPVVLTNTVWHTVGIDFLDNAVAAHESGRAMDLAVFPNPASDRCYLPLTGGTPVQVTLTDLFGRPLRQYAGRAPGLWLERANLPEGIYLVHARFANGREGFGKVIWENER